MHNILKIIGSIPGSRIMWVVVIPRIKNDKEIKCFNPPRICLTVNLATNCMIFPFSSSLSLFLILLIKAIKQG